VSKHTGFLEYRRHDAEHDGVAERLEHWREFTRGLGEAVLREQAARCMDCGIPFCHGWGCPVANAVPEMNDLVYRGRWREALEILEATNNFPELTGRLCPALCEASCTLGMHGEAVTIRQIELEIVERGWREGWITRQIARHKTGRRVAVGGSGPAGLAAAQELARMGHETVVYEKDKRVGGLLRYGIPDFKLEKRVLERRLAQMEAEGVRFETGVEIGRDVPVEKLRETFDAILLTLGAGEPRDLDVPGRELKGVHLALDYLAQQNRANDGETLGSVERIHARNKRVVVIGGGDTGSDCVGTARRQGAAEVFQLEILPKPPETRPESTPWPTWPNVLRTSTSHKEGCVREWSVLTKRFEGRDGRVRAVECCRVEWTKGDRGFQMREIPGSEFRIEAELVLLALGFVHVRHSGLVEQLGLALDARGNVKMDEDYRTSVPRLYCAGDAGRGASLVVHAIVGGREAAHRIDADLRKG